MQIHCTANIYGYEYASREVFCRISYFTNKLILQQQSNREVKEEEFVKWEIKNMYNNAEPKLKTDAVDVVTRVRVLAVRSRAASGFFFHYFFIFLLQ